MLMPWISGNGWPRRAGRGDGDGGGRGDVRLLALPPYSPDYNPIEMAIAEVKALLRSMAARETEALLEAIGVAR